MNEFDSTQMYLDVSIILHVKTLSHNLGLGEGGGGDGKLREGKALGGERMRVHR